MSQKKRFYNYRTRRHARQYADYRLLDVHANLARLYYELRFASNDVLQTIKIAMDTIQEIHEKMQNVYE